MIISDLDKSLASKMTSFVKFSREFVNNCRKCQTLCRIYNRGYNKGNFSRRSRLRGPDFSFVRFELLAPVGFDFESECRQQGILHFPVARDGVSSHKGTDDWKCHEGFGDRPGLWRVLLPHCFK